MSDERGWRTDTNALDYFTNQKKQLNVADRRPVLKTAALVGPGIGSSAVRITDYNNTLATFNGYYSSLPGAFAAPNATDKFIGTVVMDTEFGGVQTFTSLATGVLYTRLFHRNPSDPESIFWDVWEEGGGGGGKTSPVGSVLAFAGVTIPDGWLICNGATFATATYPDLYNVLGSNVLPDLQDRAVYGAGTDWPLHSTDGLALGARDKILGHDHKTLSDSVGDHNHSILSDGSHSHGLSTSAPLPTKVVASGTGATVGASNHTHGGTAAATGAHSHSGSTGLAGLHIHTSATWTGDYNGFSPTLRGVGLNYIICAE